ncbi:MAG: RDD family protein [Rickettsiales bacterium]
MSKNKKASSVRYAHIFPRFSSYFIDQILIGVIIGLFAGAFSFLSGRDSVFEENFYAYFVISLLYYSLFISGRWQATPGMRMIGLYVANEKKEKLDILTAIIRYVLYVANVLIATFISLFVAKVSMAITMCDNNISLVTEVFGKNGKLAGTMVDMTNQIDPRTISIILGISIVVKLLLIATPMFYTKHRQTLYDIFTKSVVIKGERL